MFCDSIDMKTFFYKLPIPIIVFDNNIQIVSINAETINFYKDRLEMQCNDINNYMKKWLKEEFTSFKEDIQKEKICFEKALEIKKEFLYFKISLKKIYDNNFNIKNIICILDDITIHKLNEINLKKSEKNLRRILEYMPIMMDTIDKNDNVVVWNKECEHITGYSKEEIVNNHGMWENLYPDKDYKEKVLKKIRENKCNFRDLEYDIVCKDGSIKTISWFNISEKVPVNGWSSWAFGIDVTNRKNTEVRLRKKTKELEKIFEAVPDLYLRIDYKGRILDCKAGITSDFQGASKEWMGQTFQDIIPENTKLFFKKVITKAIKTNTLVEEEFSEQYNEQLKYYESRVIPLSTDEIIIIIRDISKRKLIEQELKKSEERYKTIFDMSPDYIYLIDINNDSIVDANPAFLKKFGMTKRNLGHVTAVSLLDDKGLEICKKAVSRLIKGEEIIGLKLTAKDANKDLVYIEAHYIPVIENGNVTKVLCCSRDITETKKIRELRNKIEENIKRLNEAAKYEKFRTEFFSNISHEFRTPLNVMLGAVQLMNMYLRDVPNLKCYKKFKELNNSVKQNCYRLVRLVDNLIDITRIDSGFLELNLKNCDIVKITKDITLSVSEFAKLKSLKLEFNSDIDSKITACDPNKIERILLNLLSNAIKFTKEEGKISINIKSEKDSVIIAVKDTGIGIKEENIKDIFERFKQVNKSLTRENEGSGIGLSLVEALVKMHNGHIWVESEYGRGSEFTIKLPIGIIEDSNDEVALINIQSNKVEKIYVEFSDIYF
ncbi:PAS domain S-box protein [Clostridium aestuarii]|uniref:histidine kinase n=1 Tax=Clostridium aestuarii TaxID=338193 RepID=A0ABT4CVS0_9CLOT|nr:PAS domain S-box protein [Clostridium aestuarii]MCY6483078.1 PAS domain S-box protein [Clostridium aestuarii]